MLYLSTDKIIHIHVHTTLIEDQFMSKNLNIYKHCAFINANCARIINNIKTFP